MTIASEITRLQNDKAAICTAIENKGVTVGAVTLDDYAACIDAIEQGGGQTMLDVVVPTGNTVCLKYPSDGSYGINVAAGGIKSEVGDYYVHCYTESGTFLMNYSGYLICYLAVGGGGGGAQSGGGGGNVLFGMTSVDNTTNIKVGCGGTGFCRSSGVNTYATDGGDTEIGTIISKGGKRAGGNGQRDYTAGASGSGYPGGTICGKSHPGGGGAGGPGQNGADRYVGYGAGGCGICGYGGGGTGGQCGGTKAGIDGGGPGIKCSACGSANATNYGGGGGGNRYAGYGDSGNGGNGCQGVVDICYPTDGTFGYSTATGGNCCYTCNGYCVHRFTQDGTFAIVS